MNQKEAQYRLYKITRHFNLLSRRIKELSSELNSVNAERRSLLAEYPSIDIHSELCSNCGGDGCGACHDGVIQIETLSCLNPAEVAMPMDKFSGLDIKFKDNGTWLCVEGKSTKAMIRMEDLGTGVIVKAAFAEWCEEKRSGYLCEHGIPQCDCCDTCEREAGRRP